MYGLAIYSSLMASMLLCGVLLTLGWMIQQRRQDNGENKSVKLLHGFDTLIVREDFLKYFHDEYRPVLKEHRIAYVDSIAFGKGGTYSRPIAVSDEYCLVLIGEYKDDITHVFVSTVWVMQAAMFSYHLTKEQHQWLLEDLMREKEFQTYGFDRTNLTFVNSDTFPSMAYNYDSRIRKTHNLLDIPLEHARSLVKRTQQAA